MNLIQMTRDFDKVLEGLSSVNMEEDSKETYQSIKEYYEVYEVHRYSQILERIDKRCSEDFLEICMENIEIIITKIKSEELDEVLIPKLQKLHDHLNLQLKEIESQDKKAQEIKESLIEDFNTSNNEFTTKIASIESNIYNSIVTVLGIFSAIIFVIFGGVSSVGSILQVLNEFNRINDLLMIIILVSLIIFNIVFLLFYYISKITDKNIGGVIHYTSSEMYKIKQLRETWFSDYGYMNRKILEFYIDGNIKEELIKICFTDENDIEENQYMKILEEEVKVDSDELDEILMEIIGYRYWFLKKLISIINFFIEIFFRIYNSCIIKSIRRFHWIIIYNGLSIGLIIYLMYT
ncbi:MAG: hypothetical protein ACRC28_06265 [Clostridium sp.]|uniref:hypothetical protein n=1 Tax=Clostridia TaxID=186801 RepID=UPI003F2D7B91